MQMHHRDGHENHQAMSHPAELLRPPSAAHAGHHDHQMSMSDPAMAAGMERDIRRRFIVALLLTVPVAVLAGHVPGIPMLVRPPLSSWVGLALATPVVWWCGWIFHAGTVSALRNRSLDMSVLISTGVLAAYYSSVYLTIIGYPTAYYEEATMIVTFVLFGHWMEMKSRRRTSDALRALFDLTPPTARVLRSGAESEIATADVIVGDTLVGGSINTTGANTMEATLFVGGRDVHRVVGCGVPAERNPRARRQGRERILVEERRGDCVHDYAATTATIDGVLYRRIAPEG